MSKLGETIKLLGAIAGLLSLVAGGVFVLGGEWRKWTEVRNAFDLQNAAAASLPDFSQFALKSEVPSYQDLENYVKRGEPVAIRSVFDENNYLYDNSGNGDQYSVIVTDPGTKWTLETYR